MSAVRRLSSIGLRAPALRAVCAQAIRAALFVVVRYDGGVRWHLPLSVHEAAVRDALVPVAFFEIDC